eukprot:5867106-Prorocentrum_lima.AAC.1
MGCAGGRGGAGGCGSAGIGMAPVEEVRQRRGGRCSKGWSAGARAWPGSGGKRKVARATCL